MPNLIIIGPGKTGTTFLQGHLASHSQVQSTRIKETNAFLKENPLNQFKSSKLLKKDNYKYKYFIDSSVRYFNLSNEKIKELRSILDKETKVICILRDPYERMVSQLIQYEKTGKILKESDVQDILNSKFEHSYNNFEKNLSNWRKHFNVLLYDYEILKNNSSKFINQVYSDLALKIEDSSKIKVVNKRSLVKYKFLARSKNKLKQYSLNHENSFSLLLLRNAKKLNFIYGLINSTPYHSDNLRYNDLIKKSKLDRVLLKSLKYYNQLF